MPDQLSDQDRKDLSEIRSKLPKGDLRRQKIDRLIGPEASVSASPAPFSPAGIKSSLMTLRDKAINQLPTIGGIAGGIVGGGAGLETGPGAVATAAAGAGAGGGLGETLRQSLTEHFHPEDKKMTPKEALTGIATQTVGQGASEATGQMLGRAFRPTLESAINKLWFAGDLGPKTDLAAVMPEISAIEKTQPAKTVGDFVNVVTEAKKKIAAEVDTALMNKVDVGGKMVPLSGVKTDVTPIADSIQKVAAAHPSDALANPAKIGAVKNRIAKLYATPKTYAWLNDRRTVLNRELNRFYSMKTPADQAQYLFQHPEFEIDKAEADAIRDVVYPQMDKAAGKPSGYFEQLQRKRGALMSIEDQTQEHVENLAAKSRKAKGAPMTDPVRGYMSSSGHAGFTTRLAGILRPADVAAKADKQVAKAFEHTPRSKVGKILGTRPGMEIMSLPLRELFNPDEPDRTTP
ncbi:MAG TPA: hypothetical protein VN666_21935 [Nitrospira sp.]|nr:hypothetical protein [Nitrospira sp.]